MATPYSVIYKRALSKFTDYDSLSLSENDMEDILYDFLKSAETDFLSVCSVDLLDCDDEQCQYNNDLSNYDIEILALGMAYYWECLKIRNSKLLRANASTKEASFISNANMLREAEAARNAFKTEFDNKIKNYSYYDTDIESLKA